MIYLKKNVGFWQFGDIIFGCLYPTFVCQYCRRAQMHPTYVTWNEVTDCKLVQGCMV